jgi:uncharacterized FAD-dependent dehydrogenase
MKIVDVLIIGAGPCGLFSALELASKKKVIIVDAGKSLEDKKCHLEGSEKKCKYCRPVCNILGGFGGAQFFEGTKLSRYPAGTGLVNFCQSLEELENLYDYVDNILDKYGKSKRTKPSKEKVEELKEGFKKFDIELKYYNSQKVSKLIMNKIAKNIKDELIKHKVNIFLEEQVINIEKIKDNLFLVKTDKDEYYTHSVIIAVGRIGSRQILKIADNIGINYNDEEQQLEIGVRVEAPYKVFNKVNNVCNDIKLKEKINDKEELRSFCQDYKGFITKCVYNLKGDRIISSLDGHIIGTDEDKGKMSEVVNLAIHHRFPYFGNLNDIYDLVGKMNKNGKPIVQSMKNFLIGDNKKNSFSNELSLPDVDFDDINNYLPKTSLKLIKNFIKKVDKVLPGFADDNNAVYIPSFEMGWKKMDLNKNLESNIKGIYIGGDITGHFRGAMQSMVSGILIANHILKNEEN